MNLTYTFYQLILNDVLFCESYSGSSVTQILEIAYEAE